MKKWSVISAIVIGLLGATVSHALEIGKPAPAFEAKDSNGNTVKLSDYAGKIVVLEWTNQDCPFVKKHYSGGNMQSLQKTYTGKGVVWLTICSSADGKQGFYPGDVWNQTVTDKGIAATAVVLDPAGTVGKAYGASNTPHMFVVGADGTLIYQGAIDDTASTDAEDIPKSKNLVATAVDEALAGKPVTTATTKPYGCGVKY